MDRNSGRGRTVEFTLCSQLGVLSSNQVSGWKKELNVVAWNGGIPKYDIRDWDSEHEHMSRGVTLHESEAKTLMYLLNERFRLEKVAQPVPTPAPVPAPAQVAIPAPAAAATSSQTAPKAEAPAEVPAESAVNQYALETEVEKSSLEEEPAEESELDEE